MYLDNVKLSDIPFHDVHVKGISDEFLSRLKKKEDPILIRFIDSGKTIEYYVRDKLGNLVFSVDIHGNLKTYGIPDWIYYTDILFIFIQYLKERDDNSTEEELRKRYGNVYDEFKLLGNVTEAELTQYYQDKKDLSDLLEILKKDDAVIEETFHHDYTVQLTISYSTYNFRLDIAFIADTGKKKDSFYGYQTIYKKLYDTTTWNDIDEYSRAIFEKFVELDNRNAQRYNSDINVEINQPNLFLLYQILTMAIDHNEKNEGMKTSFQAMDDTQYIYEKPENQNIEMSITEKGELISNCDLFGKFDRVFLCPKTKACIVFFKDNKFSIYYFSNSKSLKTFTFLISHPNMRFDLFQKEITNSLVPVVAGDIQVAPSLLAKSMKMVNHFELFLSLEDGAIKSETRAFIQGTQVPLEQFRSVEPEKTDAFAFEMKKLFLPYNGFLKDEEQIAQYLTADLSQLKKTASVFISEELKKLKRKPVGRINILVNGNTDWFTLNFSSSEYSEEEVKQILQAYKKKKKFFILHDDCLILNEGESGKAIERMMTDIDVDLKKLDRKIPIYQALKLKDNSSSVLSKQIIDLFKDIQDYDDVKVDLSEDFLKVLRPYQIRGIQWMTMLKNHSLAGILADDMGLGKTLEMIAFMSQDKTEMPSLIISPKSLSYNWEAEFRKWNPSQKTVVLSIGKDERHELIQEMKADQNVVYIIPYDSLRIDLDYFKNIHFRYIVIDEGQYIANALSQKSKAIKELTSDYRFALTGTPVQNSLLDLWSIFDFLMPGYFKTFTEFKKSYGKLDITDEQKDHLEKIVSPFILKRKKEDVLKELPGKIVEVTTLSLSPKETDLYNAYLLDAKKVFAAEGKSKKIDVLAALTRLRQICVDPSSFLEYKELSSKLEYAALLIKEATMKSHKVLVFSSFKQILEHLESELVKEGVPTEKITGETPAKKRVDLSEEFNKTDDIKAMLISLKAGGTGLNLIGADIVIHLDPWWNLASEEQATDRAYRIGQEKKVTVYKLVMKNTIEEKVIELQEKKRALSDIIDKNPEEKKAITDDDIRFLLGY